MKLLSKLLELLRKRGQVTHLDECQKRDFGTVRFKNRYLQVSQHIPVSALLRTQYCLF